MVAGVLADPQLELTQTVNGATVGRRGGNTQRYRPKSL